MKLKYVITSENMPVIFHEALKHSDIAKGLQELLTLFNDYM
jgi:hypothetical protein